MGLLIEGQWHDPVVFDRSLIKGKNWQKRAGLCFNKHHLPRLTSLL